MTGLTDWALKLARAHENIQGYLIENISLEEDEASA